LAGQISKTYYPSRSQEINSVYLEARVPVFSDLLSFPGFRELEIQIAGRHDDYKEYTTDGSLNLLAPVTFNRYTQRMSSTNPTVGLKFTPVSDVMLRASYGTGFKPPSVSDLAPAPATPLTASVVSLFGLTDPRRGNQPLGALTLLGGGDPALKPEESTSRSAGIVITPRQVTGLRLSADWTDISKKNGITSLAFTESSVLDELLVPGLIQRGPVPANDPYGVGPITAFNGALINVSRLRTEAYDFQLDYGKDFPRIGTWGLSATATRLIHSTLEAAPGAPVVENVGLLSYLKWRANATLSWQKGGWTAAWTTRYYDSYWLNINRTVVATQGSATVPSQIYHDLSISYHFGTQWQALGGTLSNSDIQIGAQNVFDRKPPVDTSGSTSGFLYSGLADPRLGTWYISFRKAVW